MSPKQTSRDRLRELQRDRNIATFATFGSLRRCEGIELDGEDYHLLPARKREGLVFIADDIEGQGLNRIKDNVVIVADSHIPCDCRPTS